MSCITTYQQIPSSPPVKLFNNETNKINLLYSNSKTQIELNECTWAALKSPEVQRACYLARVCTISPPKLCRYKNIPGIIQTGPTCGLTAISMLILGQQSPSDILNLAKQRNFTYNGEMFSAQNLYELIRDVACEKDNKTIQCHFYEGVLNSTKVMNYLKNGSVIFVAYDSDFNHGPCLKMGHKAHWALIIGFLIDTNDEFYILSRHGKTKNLAVWSLKELSASNSNLMEFAQPKGYPNLNFLLPEGGIGGELGLRNRSIIVEGITADEIVLM